MSDRSPLDGFRASLLAQAVRIVANGLVIVLLARFFLSPTDYGLLFLAIAIFGSTLFLSRAGIPKSAARYVTEYRETDPGQVRNIVRTSMTAVLVLAVTVGVALVLLRDVVAVIFAEPALVPLLIGGFFYICFRSMNSYLYTLFQGFNYITKASVISICSYTGILIGVVTLSMFGFGAMGALTGYVFGYGLGTVVGLLLLYQVLRTYERSPIEPGLRRRILEYSVPLTATNGASVLYKRVDTMLVGLFIGPIAVGYYVLAKQVSDFVIAPASSLGFTISPSYAEYKAANDDSGAARIYEMAFEHTMLFYVPAAAGLALVAEPMIEYIFGADYAGAVPVIQVLAIYIILDAIDNITNDGLDFLGRARHRAIVKMSTGGLNVLLNVLLIPTIGVVGAAVSTVICYGIMVSVNVYLIHTELSLALRRLGRSMVLIFGIAICMSVVVFVMMPLVNNIIWLFVVVGVGGLSWAALALASGIPDVGGYGSWISKRVGKGQ